MNRLLQNTHIQVVWGCTETDSMLFAMIYGSGQSMLSLLLKTYAKNISMVRLSLVSAMIGSRGVQAKWNGSSIRCFLP